ncbi:MAG: S41 family peptidase, partial [Phycisphaerae bacterium]|nr:S41 family peptidase [Phycisphaerae bacterium]
GPDFEYVIAGMTQVFAIPLASGTPPPSLALAAAAGFDLKKWAKAPEQEAAADPAKRTEKDAPEAPEADELMRVEVEGMRDRIWRAPIDAGSYRLLTPTAGGVIVLRDPVRGIAGVEWPAPPLGEPIATLQHFDVLAGETKELVDGIATYASSLDGAHVVWMKGDKFTVHPMGGDGKDEVVDPSDVQVRIEPRAEWAQMLDETWRLQRDFYWAPNMAGVDWNAMRARYRALVPKLGSRSELNDVMGQLISELGTSHTYIMGGDEPDRAKPVAVGTLGADFGREGNALTIGTILAGRPGDDDLVSPLALPHLAVKPGSVVFSIDGRAARVDRDPYELLQDRAGKAVVLEIADDVQGNNRRMIEVVAREEDRGLRYANWVDGNRRAVDAMSNGTLGYVHLPDMDTDGLVEFSRTFYPQTKKRGMIVDIRDNGGGWVSQLILARIARKPWAYQAPRQGRLESYPTKVLDGPFVVLIDQNAGSDGDIFPESVRINKLAPLIGTRTWGGVIGIRADKPYLDLGLSTQPEFAWFDPQRTGEAGWSLENNGVAPDIEVDITPADRLAGRDPQLAKGVEVLLDSIKNTPRAVPTLPPYPDRSRSIPKARE